MTSTPAPANTSATSACVSGDPSAMSNSSCGMRRSDPVHRPAAAFHCNDATVAGGRSFERGTGHGSIMPGE